MAVMRLIRPPKDQDLEAVGITDKEGFWEAFEVAAIEGGGFTANVTLRKNIVTLDGFEIPLADWFAVEGK